MLENQAAAVDMPQSMILVQEQHGRRKPTCRTLTLLSSTVRSMKSTKFSALGGILEDAVASKRALWDDRRQSGLQAVMMLRLRTQGCRLG